MLVAAAAAAAAMKCKVFPTKNKSEKKRERKETNLHTLGVGEADIVWIFVCFYGKSFKGRSL